MQVQQILRRSNYINHTSLQQVCLFALVRFIFSCLTFSPTTQAFLAYDAERVGYLSVRDLKRLCHKVSIDDIELGCIEAHVIPFPVLSPAR